MIRVANAPCSWGALEFGATEEPALASQVLDEMAAAGYAGTELGDWGFLPTAPATLAADVGRRNLALVGAFVPVALARAVRTARLLAQANQVGQVGRVGQGGEEPVLLFQELRTPHVARQATRRL